MAAVSCGTSHASAVKCKYTTSVDIQKHVLVTHVEPHVSAVSLLKGAENSAILCI